MVRVSGLSPVLLIGGKVRRAHLGPGLWPGPRRQGRWGGRDIRGQRRAVDASARSADAEHRWGRPGQCAAFRRLICGIQWLGHAEQVNLLAVPQLLISIVRKWAGGSAVRQRLGMIPGMG